MEPWIRLGVFGFVLTAMVLWEVVWPRRALVAGRWARWPGNLALVVLNTAMVRLAVPVAGVGLAAIAARQGFGMLHWVSVPGWVGFLVSVVVLDLAIYGQHVVFHAVPTLWRVHRVHHADVGFDVTTGLRFHPIEILLSMAFKLAVVAALGAPADAVLAFEVVLNAASMFSHGNVYMPEWIDRAARLVLVTPDMHRLHHSVVRAETDSNYGFCLAWWDRAFLTYRAAPEGGQLGMVIGVEGGGETRLDRMLLLPWR